MLQRPTTLAKAKSHNFFFIFEPIEIEWLKYLNFNIT